MYALLGLAVAIDLLCVCLVVAAVRQKRESGRLESPHDAALEKSERDPRRARGGDARDDEALFSSGWFI